MIPEVKSITDQVIQELYMTAERKRVPEVHLEIVRRLSDANKFRPEAERLPIPSRSTIYREIERMPPYEVMVARYGKRRAEMEFRVSGAGPKTARALQRVSMDHTPSDLIIVDDKTMLPLGRPTITSALDEHTRCPMGFYTGFEPPELPLRYEVPQTRDSSEDLCAARVSFHQELLGLLWRSGTRGSR